MNRLEQLPKYDQPTLYSDIYFSAQQSIFNKNAFQ